MSAMYKNSYNLKEYILDAQHIIKEGQYIKSKNAYIKIIGGPGKKTKKYDLGKSGSSKVAIVGVDREHTRITTFHVTTVKALEDLPDVKWSK